MRYLYYVLERCVPHVSAVKAAVCAREIVLDYLKFLYPESEVSSDSCQNLGPAMWQWA